MTELAFLGKLTLRSSPHSVTILLLLSYAPAVKLPVSSTLTRVETQHKSKVCDWFHTHFPSNYICIITFCSREVSLEPYCLETSQIPSQADNPKANHSWFQKGVFFLAFSPQSYNWKSSLPSFYRWWDYEPNCYLDWGGSITVRVGCGGSLVGDPLVLIK